jgi:hypothetical protein
MSRRQFVHALAGLSVTLAVGACAAPVVGNPCPLPDNATDAERQAALAQCNAPIGQVSDSFTLHKDVDILFLIDNSFSMSPKQKALAAAIPKFIQAIDDTGANYHVGIATSDIGADTAPGVLWGGNISVSHCDSFSGDDGLLQAMPCTQRTGQSQGAMSACQTLCPNDAFVPKGGMNYISKVDGVTNVPQSLRLDTMTGKMVDDGPSKAFQCIALVGDAGCGIEGQFEGAKRALDGHRAENAGFLRSGSVLAVIYITDEDDCSVQLAQRSQLDPSTKDCDPTQPDSPNCYNVDYRCLARSLQCDQTMLTAGGKTNCKERPANFLDPVQKYHDFLTTLRPDPQKLLISGIWTKPSILGTGQVQIAAVNPGTGTPALNRATMTNAACYYQTDPTIFGQAQIRLSEFAALFGTDQTTGKPNALELSICDIDNYPAALDNIANALKVKLGASCVPVVPKLVGGKPNCVVGDVDDSTPTAAPDIQFPVCSATCCNAFAASATPNPADPNIQNACAGETTDACYCAIKSTANQCNGAGETGYVAGVWRKGGGGAPSGKVVNFLCAGGG